MTTLKRLKHVNDRYKLTVFGYIHGNEKQLSLSNVPTMIGYLSLSYYFHGEGFEKASNDINISNDKLTITRTAGPVTWNACAFGKVWVDSMINCVAKWTLKINYLHQDKSNWAHVIICLLSKDDESRASQICAPYYEIDGLGQMKKNETGGVNTYLQGRLYCLRFKKNDEIELELDTGKGDIYLTKNDGMKHPLP